MLLSGIRAKISEPYRLGDVKIWQKILQNYLLDVQCPSIILSILRNQRESIDTFFPWMRKAKKEKKRWS
jgi:hypothetical protein